MRPLIRRSMHEATTTRGTRFALEFDIGGMRKGLSSNINRRRNNEMMNLVVLSKEFFFD